ncbi:MAG: PQQ-binding-like beta-propeller repeat protein [Planctomycetes bacterium]|nr:PQQ-binding-like beta-propeller repeat protein [Planctomycetota bacterium]
MSHRLFAPLIVVAISGAEVLGATQIRVLLPLGRTAYQTNEWIDVDVARSADGALPACDLTLALRGDDGSDLTFVFALPAVPVRGKDAGRTEHLHLDGRLLRPGRYAVEIACDGARASAEIEVATHIRKRAFRVIDWGVVKGEEHERLGEESLGFNTMYGQFRRQDAIVQAEGAIRGGLDFLQVCTMSGGHQMDLRTECDWSDPNVTRGGVARVVHQAFLNRTAPNSIGVHFYDEPGLTWHEHPETGEWTPHGIPSQVRAFRAAFGRDPLPYHSVDPNDPASVAGWIGWGRWKLSFLEAAWRLARQGVETVRPDTLTANQTQYAWYAYADGYYFNVGRSLPVLSGHGGYDDMPLGYFHPSYYFEFGRMRDFAKQMWYLPVWYGNTPANRFRLEQYLSFMTNLQGLMTPPDLRMQRPSTVPAAEGVVESNILAGRLGAIFTTMPLDRPDAAVLYSITHCLTAQARDRTDNYDGGGHRTKLMYVYLASRRNRIPLFPIVEEDVLDGTLAAHHRAVVLAGIDALPPAVVRALEAFAAGGGAVIATDDARVRVRGAIPLGCPVDISLPLDLERLWREGKQEEIERRNRVGDHLDAVASLADALAERLRAAGIRPVFESSEPGISGWRQRNGGIEYLFAANASYDAGAGEKNSLRAAAATIALPADDRPIYDAIRGGVAAEFVRTATPRGGRMEAALRFGPGEMRAFARTARPIGGVQVLPPAIRFDSTARGSPLRLEIEAILVDAAGRVIAGSAPVSIRVVDPLGAVRYELDRATKRGHFRIDLPLAANDPAGEWTVCVRERLAESEGSAHFTFRPPPRPAAIAGATRRAVFFRGDREAVFRFFRTHRDVAIVKGSGGYDGAAARLAEILAPWNIRCRILGADQAKAPRSIAPDEAPTWIGLEFTGRDAVKPGRSNAPAHVGFDVREPAILLGNPEDNPLIEFLDAYRFLPYRPSPDMPGPGRGMVAWVRDGISYGQEAIALIASDAEGMDEAIGSLYEGVAGLDPLTPFTLPVDATMAGAVKSPATAPALAIEWSIALPDRVAGIRALPGGGAVALSQDGTLAALDAAGRMIWSRTVPAGEEAAMDVATEAGTIVIGTGRMLAAFDQAGGVLFQLEISGAAPQARRVTSVAASPGGERLAIGTADGSVSARSARGKELWRIGGEGKADPPIAGIFFDDGSRLIVLTGKKADLLDASDGSRIASFPGLTGRVRPVRAGSAVIASDGGRAVLAIATDGSAAAVPFPGEGVAVLAAAGGDLVAGTETDGAARILDRGSASREDLVVGAYRLRGRIPKRIATKGDSIAVGHWGGTIAVIDRRGGVVGIASLPQDIADIAWTAESRLIAGVADGRIFGLAGPRSAR